MNKNICISIFIILLPYIIDPSHKIEGIAFPGMHHFQSSKNYDLNLRLIQKLIDSLKKTECHMTKSHRSYDFTTLTEDTLPQLTCNQVFIKKTPVSSPCKSCYKDCMFDIS